MKAKILLIAFFLILIEVNGQRVIHFTNTDKPKNERIWMSIKDSLEKLETFDTVLISSNIEYFYYDLGLAYYYRYAYTMDTNYLRKSTQTFEKAIFHKINLFYVWWKLSLGYHLLGDYNKSVYYTSWYKKNQPIKCSPFGH